MILIQADNLQYALGKKNLLTHAKLLLEEKECLGLVGRNGVGKSTLLKILAGLIQVDDGVIHYQKDLKLAYVSQDTQFDNNKTIFQILADSLGETAKLISDFTTLNNHIVKYPNDEETLKKIAELQVKIDIENGWILNNQILQSISDLQLPADALIGNLSGGQKKRLQLTQAWIQKPDVLLLDEPTNHLDIDAIVSLEKNLNNFKGSAIVISHDRAFLDNITSRIIELDRGILQSYPGNFQKYQQRKQQELDAEEENNRLFDKFLSAEEVWIRKGIEARRTRNEGRVKRLEELRKIRQARRDRIGNVQFSLSQAKLSGKIVVDFDHASFNFANQNIIQNYTSVIQRGDKVGLIGPNGIGKTTFLKLALGELKPNSGNISLGSNQQIAYFDQFRNHLDEHETVFNSIGEGKDTVTINNKSRHIISYLEDFLFEPVQANSPVSALSGGEKNRLLLAKLFTKPANIIVLDEPTNDLDIETQELLEQLLRDFTGTVFLVSHDRTFLDNIVTQCIVFKGDGQLIDIIGGYQDYLNSHISNNEQNISKEIKKKTAIDLSPTQPTKLKDNKEKIKLTYKEKKELESLPQEISLLEEEQLDLNNKLIQPEIFKNHYQEAIIWQQRVAELDELIANKLERWEELEIKQSNENQ